jgi:hypothetical protein
MTTNQFHQRTTSLGGSHHRSRSQTPTNKDRTTPIASVRHEKYKISEFKSTQNGVEILNMDLMQLSEDFDPKFMSKQKI